MARKKAVARKPANKSDQILTLLRGLDKKFTGKFEGLSRDFKSLNKDVEGLSQNFEGLSKDVEGLSKDFVGLSQKFDGLDQKVDRIDQEAKDFREQHGKFEAATNRRFDALDEKVERIDQEAKNFRQHHLKFEAETKRRFDAMEIKIIGFKDEMLSVADVTRKEYDETRQERLMTGLALDRQQKELDALKLSDGKQNQALDNLDGRVTTLEMNKAA